MTLDKQVNEELDLDPHIILKRQTGDHTAQLEIGQAYYQATHIEDNCYSAFRWIKASAEQNNAEAQFLLADMYSLGHGVDRDTLAAHEWYTKSALQDYPKALIRVHNLYHEDKKIHCRGELSSEEEGMNEPEFKKNNDVRELSEHRLKTMQAKNLLGYTMNFFSAQFKDLTESNDKGADNYYKIGFLYHHGYGIREIHSRAIECYSIAAKKDHTSAQYNLGCLYQENTDIKFNYRLAFKWFKLAAEAGHSSAQNCLAYFFEKGINVETDFSEALFWYSKAASNNNKGAMVNIARMYRKGLVDDQPNYSQSIKWYKKAAQLGSLAAKNCLYQLSQRKDIVDSNDSTKGDLLYGGPSVEDRLCSRLRQDVSTMSDGPKFDQLEKLAAHALVGDGNAMLKVGIKYFNGSTFTQNKETGVKWIQNAARSGLLKAQLLIGKLYENGRTDVVKQDYHKAVIWYSLAAKQKSDVAQHKVGLFYYNGHGLRIDPLEASRWFTWSADQNNSNAQCMLGLLRSIGEGLRKNDFEAFQWLTKSGSQQNPQALYYLGLIERRGIKFSTDGTIKIGQVLQKAFLKKALYFFEYAAKHGCLDAQLLLARMYDGGDHLHIDPNEVFQYYTQAAKHGNSETIYKVGYMYLEGRGIKQDYIKAYKYITKAAEKNHPDAKSLLVAPIKESIKNIDYSKVLKMFEAVTVKGTASLGYNIGCFYENGFGDHNSRRIIEEDFFRARYWYEQAEKNNNPEAIHRLGMLYQLGKIRKDYNVAHQYFRKGVELEHLDSFYELAQLYLVGNGVTKDVDMAFNLFSQAASLGHPGARSVLSLLYETKATIVNPFKNDSIKGMMEEVGSKGNTIVQYRFGCYYESSGDIKLAIKWYELATQGKLTDAYYRLGRIYEIEGYQNLPKAIELYEAASDNYHDEATYREAQLYHYGNGIPQNYPKAFQLYTKAANLGNRTVTALLDIKQVFKRNRVDNSNNTGTSNTTAIGNTTLKLTSEELKELLLMHEYIARHGDANQQYNVGYVYENGLETPDYENAFQWYSIAAFNSHKDAIYRLGLLYLHGNGLPQNFTLATEFFIKAMGLGSADACYQLGLMSSSGRMTDIDYPKAEYYFILAANKGHYDAQFKLGQLYEDSYIAGKDFLVALKWYTKAFLQTSNQAILHLDELDDDPNFIIQHYSKQFQKLTRYSSHRLGKFSENDAINYEKTTGRSLQFYGHVHYQLGYMYISGLSVVVDYEKAWYHFYISHKVFNTRQALYFMNVETDITDNLETPMYLKKIEMLSAFTRDLDAEQLYQLACAIYSRTRFEKAYNSSIIYPDDRLVFELLNRSIEKGKLKSKKLLGDMYYFGYGVKVDLEKSLQNHIDCSSSQDGQENFRTGVEYYDSKKHNSQGWTIALVYIIKASNQKNIDAQKYLSDLFNAGQNTTSFHKDIGNLHKALAAQQSGNENMDAGIRYLYGCGNTKMDPLTGLIYLQRAADQGNPVAQRILGDLYYYGINVDRNHDKAKELHKSSSSQLNSRDCIRMGESYFNGSTLFTKNHEIAFIYLNESITKGSYEAGRYLGDMYFSGDVVEIDQFKALQFHKQFAVNQSEKHLISIGQSYYIKEWYSIAAIYMTKTKGNDPTTLRHLGNMYYEGKGVEKNREKSLWYHKASASLLMKELNYQIGLKYFNNTSDSKLNVEAGLIYINEAINQGYSIATRFPADKYYYRDNVIGKDQAKALKLHKMSADCIDGPGNFKIGKTYYEGTISITKNTPIGLVYLNKAAFDQNYPSALQYLGDLFYYGNGDIDEDRVKALGLHKMSANSRNGSENFNLGKEYYEGHDNIQKNTTIGLIYLNRAAFDQNYPSALQYLGDLFYHGDGDVDEDRVMALELHKMSTTLIDKYKNFEIGKAYHEGHDNIQKNTTIGLIYLNRAAFDQNYPSALQYLGDLFYYGDGDIDEDRVEALNLHKMSANSRNGSENFKIGKTYYEGTISITKNTPIGLVYLNRAAFDQNYPSALQYLGDLFYYGDGDIDEDRVKALELHKMSANSRNGSENFNLGKEYYEGHDNLQKNTTIGLIYLNRAAFDRNYPSALQYLGDLFYYGDGDTDEDRVMALELHKMSTTLIDKYKNFEIGKAYHEGHDNIQKNTTIGLIYLNRAAFDQNYPSALQYLGDLFYHGDGDVDEDRVMALEFHKMSTTLIDKYKNFEIGKAYHEGHDNIQKNTTIGLIYLNRAAFDQNYPSALQYLGDLFYHGDGDVDEDRVMALGLHKMSANSRNGSENFNLGKEYYEGHDNLQKNTTIGLIYLDRAAFDQNYPSALRYLGNLFDYGDGDIDEDQVEALKFHKMSAENGDRYVNFVLGKEYYEGHDNLQKNTTIGLIYLNRAAFDQDVPDALQYLGDLFYYGDGNIDEDRVEALKLHKMSSALVDRFANFSLGKAYYEGHGNLQKNITIGIVYISAALDIGYYFGKAYEKDPKAALDKNYSRFNKCLSDIYYFGEAYKKDSKTASDLIMALGSNM